MPRDGMKGSGSGGPSAGRSTRGGNRSARGGVSSKKKIVIRPYQKPPALPANFYEDTVQGLLLGTLNVLKNDDHIMTTQEKSAASISLQNAYTAVIHLVSHQFGPRLYRDLQKSMEEAAKMALAESFSFSDAGLLRRIPQIYEKYTQYLLCVQHVFLPLDRTHLWLPETQDVLLLRSAASATSGVETNTTPSTGTSTSFGGSGGPNPAMPIQQSVQQDQQTIWQVGLAVFGKRLAALGYDSRLYQEWLRALLYDWNPGGDFPAKLANIDSSVEEHPLRRRQDLQAIWYVWQDLGWWSVLPLPQDLEEYWRGVSHRWTENSSNGIATKLIEFIHEKHQHVQQWPWLPTG